MTLCVHPAIGQVLNLCLPSACPSLQCTSTRHQQQLQLQMDLPEQVLGKVYSLLPTKEDRRSFAHCCKAVHDAPSVLGQICSLRMFLRPGHFRRAVKCLAAFPR